MPTFTRRPHSGTDRENDASFPALQRVLLKRNVSSPSAGPAKLEPFQAVVANDAAPERCPDQARGICASCPEAAKTRDTWSA